MRSASDARYYREQFQLSQVYQDCWLTIIYLLDGAYKTLHLIAPSVDVFRVWDTTLRKVYAIRLELMSGLGNFEMRQALWEKQYWKGSELEENERLRFGEVEKLCRKMNIHSSVESLFSLFTVRLWSRPLASSFFLMGGWEGSKRMSRIAGTSILTILDGL